MCQWKFLVFRYSASVSASSVLSSAVMSRVASSLRALGVFSDAFLRSAVFLLSFIQMPPEKCGVGSRGRLRRAAAFFYDQCTRCCLSGMCGVTCVDKNEP